MEEFNTNTQNLKAHVGEYVNTYIQLTKAKVTQAAANVSSAMTIIIGALFFSLFFLQFIFLGLAWWIGSLLKSPAAGYFIVAGLFLLIVLLLFALRKKYLSPLIRNAIIGIMYEQKKHPNVGEKN